MFNKITGLALSECPKPEVVSPCDCKTSTFGNEIHCKNSSIETVQSSLKRISSQIKKKHFRLLNITMDKNTQSANIPANFTDALTFDFLEIQVDDSFCNWTFAPMRVHQSAFAGTANKLKRFSIMCFNVSVGPKPYNIFDSINSFPNLNILYLGGVARIPVTAFKTLDKLQILALIGPIKPYIYPLDKYNPTVGVEAFYQLDNLEHFQLGVDYLPGKAFRMKRSTKPLTFVVLGPNMNGSSFSIGSVNQFARPTKIWLETPILTFVPENVFEWFFEADPLNRLSMGYKVPLNCTDCRNAWLGKKPDKYKAKVQRAYCDGKEDGPTIFDAKYDNCKHL